MEIIVSIRTVQEDKKFFLSVIICLILFLVEGVSKNFIPVHIYAILKACGTFTIAGSAPLKVFVSQSSPERGSVFKPT